MFIARHFCVNESRLITQKLNAYPIAMSKRLIKDNKRKLKEERKLDLIDHSQFTLKEFVDGLSQIINTTCSYAYIKDIKGRYVYVNTLYQSLFDSSHKSIIGLDDEILFENEQAAKNRLSDSQVLNFDESLAFEEQVKIKGEDSYRIFWTNKSRIYGKDGSIIGLSAISSDLTKIKQKTKFENVINETLEEIASGTIFESIFLKLTKGVESLLPSTRCSILLLTEDGEHLVEGEVSSLPFEYNQAINGIKIGLGVGSCGTAAFTAKRVVVEDVSNHPYWDKYKELANFSHIAACWSQPILSSKGKVLGTFAIYHRKPSKPSLNDISIIEQFAHLASIAIERDINDKALEQKESYQRALLDNFPFLIWFKDKTGKFLTVNKAFAFACGFKSHQEVIGKTDFDIWPESLAKKYKKDDEEVILRDGHINNEELIEINGSQCWFETYKSPIKIMSNVVGTVGFSREITERKLSELEIAKSNALLQAVIENIPVRVFWKDNHLNYLGCNKIFAHDAGIGNPTDIIGKNDFDFSWSHEAPLYRTDDLSIIESGHSKLHFEESQTTPSGDTIWVRTSKVPLISADGERLGILGLYEDITKEKMAENDLRIAATAFQSQEGIMITDANSKIIKVNQAFSLITGYTSEEVIGKPPSILSSGHHAEEFYKDMWKHLNANGSWEGEIWNRRKNGEIYPEHLMITAVHNAQNEVTNYVATLTDTSFRNKADKEIQYLAFYDPLTGLPNRRLLQDRLSQTLVNNSRSQQRSALLFIDLDHFKLLNDTYGHDNGDILLKQVAERLLSCVREGDTVARLGGDEFVIILENLGVQDFEAASLAEGIASKILIVLNVPYLIGIHEHISTPSIGIVIIDNQLSINEILKQADIAMYQAKKAGRNTVRFFNPEMQASINSRVNMERSLRAALEKNEFTLFYQPQCDSNGVTIGVEALIRWNKHGKDMVSPAEFIPLAEETGLIVPIGAWVLETACAQLKQWKNDAQMQRLSLSVNISAKQLRQSDFCSQLSSLISRYDIDPTLLKLELTESMLLENMEETIACMNQLGKMNISFSLDDFGTGYSSLQYLKRLPLYQLKIDQSFVRDISSDPSDRAIVSTIIAMANNLNLRVIAEGVETIEQHQFLLNEGCNEFQGYYFGKPMKISDFEKSFKN